MIGRVLLFKTADSCYESVNVMVDNLEKEYLKLGIECDEIDVSMNREQVLQAMGIIDSGRYDAAIAFNAVGQQDVTIAGENIFDHFGIPFINILLDHPMDHYLNLNSSCKNYHVVCLDRNHESFLKAYFHNLAGVHFLPLAAEYDEEAEPKEISIRSKDIIFAGSLIKKSCAELFEEYKKYPEPYNDIIMRVLDRMLTCRDEDIGVAYDHVIRDDMRLDISTSDYLDILSKIQICNYFMRTYLREEILGDLLKAKVPIHLYGGGMDRLLNAFPENRAIYHGSVPFSSIPEIYSDAKIVINIMPMFKNGCHDRIPFAMLQGSAVLTDRSKYIDDTFPDCVYTYSYDGTIADTIKNILSDEKKLSETAFRGREYALNNMTWECYAKKLLQIVV
ncbi:MAG: hypothetical protein J5504_04945 [Butyrivibrio sp.]|nr:hypothetical protein [Butyrivibrio sp.]